VISAPKRLRKKTVFNDGDALKGRQFSKASGIAESAALIRNLVFSAAQTCLLHTFGERVAAAALVTIRL